MFTGISCIGKSGRLLTCAKRGCTVTLGWVSCVGEGSTGGVCMLGGMAGSEGSTGGVCMLGGMAGTCG